jgi:hypothetical protein
MLLNRNSHFGSSRLTGLFSHLLCVPDAAFLFQLTRNFTKLIFLLSFVLVNLGSMLLLFSLSLNSFLEVIFHLLSHRACGL